jgi:tetratricopeptide (TPR) repeat protein
LKQYAAAIDAYRACAALGGWVEEGAWACFRAAECYCALERWSEAIETCARGLAIRPATAELAWLAGWAAYKAKRYEDAIAWSNMAIVNGLYEGAGASFERIGFRYPTGQYEGPYDVLRWTFAALGNAAASAEAVNGRLQSRPGRACRNRLATSRAATPDRRPSQPSSQVSCM